MTSKAGVLGLGVVVVLTAVGVQAEVRVAASVPFADGVNVPLAVRNECQLGEKLASFLAEYNPDVQIVADPRVDVGRALDLQITEVHAPGGGVFSGPKWMEVKGALRDDGRTIGSFRAKRFSGGGAFAQFKGTCAIVGRCARAIAKDIAEWLHNPTATLLGDARGSQ